MLAIIKILKNFNLALDPNRIKQFLQIQDNSLNTLYIDELIEECLIESAKLLKPQAIWYTTTKTEALLNINGEKTREFFKNCERITFLAVTIGFLIEKKANDYMARGEITKGFIMDSIGSDGVEQAADVVNLQIAKDIKQLGFYPTLRFSPGYGDWPLEQQKSLVDILDTKQIGISLTKSFQLQPLKSITAAIGWSNQPESETYPTWSCQQKCTANKSCKNCIKYNIHKTVD